MPRITDRSTRTPVLETLRLGHGTLEVVDLARSRRFYEEVLGLEVIQPSPLSLMIRKDTQHSYAVVETGRESSMGLLGHNGLEVAGAEEVDAAYEAVSRVKDEYEIKQVQKPRHMHGDYSFYIQDPDGNWWEIVAVRPGGYAADFADEERDLTGLHLLDDLPTDAGLLHTHDSAFRETVRQKKAAGDGPRP